MTIQAIPEDRPSEESEIQNGSVPEARRLSSQETEARRRSLLTLLRRKARASRFKSAMPEELADHIVYKEIPWFFVEDYMHSLVSLSWGKLLLLIILTIFIFVFTFALLFYAASSGEDWWDSYNLSVQTWCTIGYGNIFPSNDAAEFVSFLTTFVSFVFVAVCTGLAFVKFSLPYASMAWAQLGVIHLNEGKPCLVIRAAMMSAHEKLVDCNFQMFAIAPRVSKEGYVMLSSTELRLQNPNPLSLPPNFNIIHEIERNSVVGQLLWGGGKSIQDFVIAIRLIAYSMNFQSDVATIKFYHADSLLIGHRYVDMIELPEESAHNLRMVLKLESLGKTVAPLDIDRKLLPAPGVERANSIPLRKLFRPPSSAQITPMAKGKENSWHPDAAVHRLATTPAPRPLHKRRISHTCRANSDRSDGDEDSVLSPPLKRQHSFRECKLTEKRCCQWCYNIHWSSETQQKDARVVFDIQQSGVCTACTHCLHPRVWFSSLTQGRWYVTILALFVIYAVTTVFFGLLMYADPDSLPEDVRNGNSFLPYLWWSHHTLSTVGYGRLSPNNAYGHFLVTMEGILGLVLLAFMAGVAWAKFSALHPRILWCEHAVVNVYDGEPTLMIRCASLWRGHLMLTARARISAIVRTHDGDEAVVARQIPVKLVREWNPVFALSGTFMHKIDSESPLIGILPASYRQARNLHAKSSARNKSPKGTPHTLVRLVCLVEAFDGLFQRTVVSQHVYRPERNKVESDEPSPSTIQIGYKFEDIIMQDARSHKVVIDYSRMHRIVVIPNSSLRRPDRKHDSFSGFGALNARRPKGKAGVSQSVPPMEVKILEDEEEDTKKGRQGSQAATTSGNPISPGTSAPAPSGGGGKRERVRSAPSAMRQFHNKLQRSPKSKPRSTLKAASSNSERALEKDKGGEVQILDVKVNVGYKRPERIRH